MRYFISIVGVVAGVLLLCFVTQESGFVQLLYMVDGITLVILLLVVITIMISAGLHKDFIQAFRLALSKGEDISLPKLKRAKEAVDLTIKSIVGAGVLISSIGAVQSFAQGLQETTMPCLGVSALGIVYAVMLFLLLLPIQTKLKVKIMKYMEE